MRITFYKDPTGMAEAVLAMPIYCQDNINMAPANNNYIRYHNILNCGEPLEILKEVKHIIGLITQDFDYSLLDTTHADITLLFNGKLPGYRSSNTKYHNLDHSNSVFLALARLTHGLFLNGSSFSNKTIELGLISALFHDTGFIQEKHDLEGTGAKYMIGHEQRSIALMEKYLSAKGKNPLDIADCAQMIECTISSLSPSEISFNSDKIMLMGHVLGTTDLLAQMAVRNYLEKLPMLFLEFQEGGVSDYESLLDLIQKTGDFYKHFALKRLSNDFYRIADNMIDHFKARWDIDKDLYATSMKNQIQHLKSIGVKNLEKDEEVLKYFRRGV